jgi:hypothetical protein
MRWLVLTAGFLVAAGSGAAWEMSTIAVQSGEVDAVSRFLRSQGTDCKLDYFYLLDGCAYVTTVAGASEGESFGVHFNMADSVAWYEPCDQGACTALDIIDLVLYDVLPSPADQSMNIKVYGADAAGDPTGTMLGNRDFEPAHMGPGAFTTVSLDFTNGGTEPGLDVSGCGGDFVVLLTWKNATGKPALVLDHISTCVDSCATNAACCQMGMDPYLYPRQITHTYAYGAEFAWSKQDSFCDAGGCGTYGLLEAFWTCRFCDISAAAKPTSWGTIKAMYR